MGKWDGMVLRTSYIDFHPWYIPYINSEGRRMVHGLLGSMIGNITQSLNITYEMFLPPDGQYGMVFPNGTMNGQLLMLQKGDVDLSLGPYIPNWVIHKYFHVPQPPRYTHTTILSGMRNAWIKKPAVFTNAFDLETWMYVLISALAVIVIVLVYRKYLQNSSISFMEQLGDELFIALQTLLQESTKERFHNNFTKFVGGTWILGTFILCQMFTSQGKANLVVKSPTLRLDTLDMILERPELKIIFPINTPLHNILLYMPGERGERVRAHMDSNGIALEIWKIYNPEIQELLGNGKGALLLDIQSQTTNVYSWCPKTKYFYYIGTENVVELPAFWATAKTLPEELNKAMDRRISWILAMDVPFMKFHELYNGHSNCMATRTRSRTETAEPLMVQDIEFTFYTWMAGMAGSIIIIILELTYNVVARTLR